MAISSAVGICSAAVPLLISMLIVALLGLVSWSMWKYQSDPTDDALLDSYDQMLLGLLTLAVFALGVFSTCFLMLGF